ncbi:hypothetical protein GCM10010433_51290 [Streptomyces pulveraceus]
MEFSVPSVGRNRPDREEGAARCPVAGTAAHRAGLRGPVGAGFVRVGAVPRPPLPRVRERQAGADAV